MKNSKFQTSYSISQISIDLAVSHIAKTASQSEQIMNAVARAKACRTPARYRQRALAAGREALVERLFHIFPELNNNIQNLTKALRQSNPDTDFNAINEQGAKALGLL